jgi:hypothetical protein
VTDFRIWGTVNQTGPQEFHVLVSAVSDPEGIGMSEWEIAPCREDAVKRQPSLGSKLMVQIAAAGDRIIDVEYAE